MLRTLFTLPFCAVFLFLGLCVAENAVAEPHYRPYKPRVYKSHRNSAHYDSHRQTRVASGRASNKTSSQNQASHYSAKRSIQPAAANLPILQHDARKMTRPSQAVNAGSLGNVPRYGYGFSSPRYRWGYFGASHYYPRTLSHHGYNSDYWQWAYRLGY